MELKLKAQTSTIKPNVQFYAGKLLGFYEAGDKLLNWINSVDSSDMSNRDFRAAVYRFVADMRPEIKVGRTGTA